MACFGPDGSHHQDGMTVAGADWSIIDFVIWRSSIGSRVDRTFNDWRNLAQSKGKAFCAYHFVYRTEAPAGAAHRAHTPDAHADTDEQALGMDKSVPVMLDWEHDGAQVPTFDDCLAVAAELRSRGYRVPLLYTGAWYWAQMGRPTLAGHGMALVNSNYGNQSPTGTYEVADRYNVLGGDNSARWSVEYGGLSPTIWQFGSRVRWGDRYMDMNAHRGPVHELHNWFWTVPEPPHPSEEPEVTLDNEDLIAIRNSVWKATLVDGASGRPASAEALIGWLRRDVVTLRRALLDETGFADRLAAAVVAGLPSGADAAAVSQAVVAALAAELSD
jgi:hypothetical protein